MKILFIHQHLQSFVQKDLDILRSVHEVREIRFAGLKVVPMIYEGVAWADLIFCWFGKLHAFFAVLFSKILGKKAVVVAGGDDVAYEPQIRYGMFSFWWKKWCPRFVFRYADLILSVSEFNRQETIHNARANREKVKLLYHGFDAQRFTPTGGVKKEELVITVGGVDWERLERKGYERFVKTATYLPEARFVLVGQWYDNAVDYLRKVAPSNVTFMGQVNDRELVDWLSRAKVYVQASIHEGFGCSLAEAMLCECVPVISRRAALPEVVGDCGLYMDDLNPQAVAIRIKEAFEAPKELGVKARQRILTLFPLEKRKEGLLNAMAELISR